MILLFLSLLGLVVNVVRLHEHQTPHTQYTQQVRFFPFSPHLVCSLSISDSLTFVIVFCVSDCLFVCLFLSPSEHPLLDQGRSPVKCHYCVWFGVLWSLYQQVFSLSFLHLHSHVLALPHFQ